MPKPIAAPATVARLITFGSAILVAFACASPKTEPQPRVVIDSANIYAGGWSTPLPEGVSPNPDKFRASLTQPMYKGTKYTRRRAATGCGGCAVEVSIQAITPTSDIGPGRPPRPARAVARMLNLDPTHVEAYYGFKPQSQAEYYFWIDAPPRADSARITVLQVPTARDSLVRAGRQKSLAVCHRYPHSPSPPIGDADFVEYRYKDGPCIGASPPMLKKSGLTLFPVRAIGRMIKRLLQDGGLTSITSEGGWIDCNSGCCT